MDAFDPAVLPPFEERDYEEIADDGLDRPPLRGQTSPPQGLTDVDWAALEDAYGPATETPLYLEAITSDDDGDVAYGAFGLYSATTHQGSVFSASGAAIPFLSELVGRDNVTAMTYLARIAVGETHFIATPRDLDARTEYADAVAAHGDIIRAHAERTDDSEAWRLLALLGLLPETLLIDLETNDPSLLADRLMLAGFAAALSGEDSKCRLRVERARQLVRTSSSLLVRLAASAFLAFTGVADDYARHLLAHLSDSEEYVASTWITAVGPFAEGVWLYSATDDELAGADVPATLRVAAVEERVRRALPPGYDADFVIPARAVSAELREILAASVTTSPDLFAGGSFELISRGLPATRPAVERLAGLRDDVLSLVTGPNTLAELIESDLRAGDVQDATIATIVASGPWSVTTAALAGDTTSSEHTTLGIRLPRSVPDDPMLETLVSLLGEALSRGDLDASSQFLAHALARPDAPGMRVAVSLLAHALAGRFDERFLPLVRSFHRHPEYSPAPIAVLRRIRNLLPPVMAERITLPS
ncbi:hypothetical protein [Microbacterium gorillae]|uniref:hypothetical protein n=1 Tax=Microbacterium gorillae TaxID=1231063 RepID=UPI003D971939